MAIKHTISFKLRTYGLKGGKCQIRLRISFNGFRHEVMTGCVILDRNAWDEKAGLVKDGYVGLRGETPNIVMKWTGHSDYKAMKPYIDSIKASEMSKMNFLDLLGTGLEFRL